MRLITPDELERGRVTTGPYRSTSLDGLCGAFHIHVGGAELYALCDDGATTLWEHVSVSLKNRCPTWNEMNHIRGLFWTPEETVMQFHPRADQYVNRCKNCLHLWRKKGTTIDLPPRFLIG